jgi:hypothetical protein
MNPLAGFRLNYSHYLTYGSLHTIEDSSVALAPNRPAGKNDQRFSPFGTPCRQYAREIPIPGS